MAGEFETFLKEERNRISNSSFGELEDALEKIREEAKGFGLDPLPTHFEIIPPEIMHEMGAYGLPGRFSHWTHGRAFRQFQTRYNYGLERIYEMVINSNPAQAFLMENNSPIQNKLVMAHVLGHTDFFNINYWFEKTRKDMTHVAASNAERKRLYDGEEGGLRVEQFLDAVLAIEEHIDPYNLYRLPKDEQIKLWKEEKRTASNKKPAPGEFDDLFKEECKLERAAKKAGDEGPSIPLHPDRDVLGFVRDFATELEDWQRDLIDTVRMEGCYFYPQRRTKITNEGWASFVHREIMRRCAEKRIIRDDEEEEFWSMHAGITASSPRGFNPYYFGLSLFDWVETYFNGDVTDQEKRVLESEDMPVYPRYHGPIEDSPGRKKLFEIREWEDDQSFIRNYFGPVTAERMKMFVYGKKVEDGEVLYYVKDKRWQAVRNSLVNSLSNCGDPYIEVVDGDHGKKSELYLRHVYEGRELDISYIEKTMPYVYQLWGRPVHLETTINDKIARFCCDGKKVQRNN